MSHPSAASWKSAIKQEYIRFLTFAPASCDETTDHLETLYETGSLKDEALYKELHQRLQTLGKNWRNALTATGRFEAQLR